jgi:hypothetical protein
MHLRLSRLHKQQTVHDEGTLEATWYIDCDDAVHLKFTIRDMLPLMGKTTCARQHCCIRFVDILVRAVGFGNFYVMIAVVLLISR